MNRFSTFQSFSFLTFLIVCSFSLMAFTKPHDEFPLDEDPDLIVSYKQVSDTELKLHIYYPHDYSKGEQRPAIIFFFGGGWVGGSVIQFRPHALHYASLGMVAVLAEYRIKQKHGTTPFEAVADAKSAIRYLRRNAFSLGINPYRIVGSGGSAGGHLAAATAMLDGLNEPAEPLDVSCIPNALVLFNPVIDNGPTGYGYERIGDRYNEISPMHNIKNETPPCILFLGTNDNLIPVSTAEAFKKEMESVGSRCDLILYEGAGHGFFNHQNIDYYNATILESDKFLRSLGYIE